MKKINLALPIFVSLISFVFSHAGEDDSVHHNMMGFSSFGMNFFGWIFMILVIVALVLLIIWLVNELTKKKRLKRK